MINDSDPEIAELGHSEHKRLIEEEAKLCEDLKIALLPKDPNDDKNIIVEIRGAAGGDEGNIFAGDLFSDAQFEFARLIVRVILQSVHQQHVIEVDRIGLAEQCSVKIEYGNAVFCRDEV